MRSCIWKILKYVAPFITRVKPRHVQIFKASFCIHEEKISYKNPLFTVLMHAKGVSDVGDENLS